MTHDGRIAVAQDFFQKCFHGDVSEAVLSLDPNVIYDVPGTHRLAGRFEGPESVARHITELLNITHKTVNVLQWEDWLVGVNHLATVVRIRLQLAGSIQTVRLIYLIVMSEADKIRRIEVFFSDQAAMDRLVSQSVGK